ncbi:MAG TPA: hypothetical protein PKK43_01905 [Spirochaetota bacterium]|nr:hypothetical protein [Spirochaetota bacterium]
MLKFDRVFRIYSALTALVLLLWWPLSHWLYSDLYHSIMIFAPGSYQESMVKMIGTCGFLPVLLLGYLTFAKNRPSELVYILSVFALLVGATFFYLIIIGQFPAKEYINAGLCLLTSIILPLLDRSARLVSGARS